MKHLGKNINLDTFAMKGYINIIKNSNKCIKNVVIIPPSTGLLFDIYITFNINGIETHSKFYSLHLIDLIQSLTPDINKFIKEQNDFLSNDFINKDFIETLLIHRFEFFNNSPIDWVKHANIIHDISKKDITPTIALNEILELDLSEIAIK